MTTDIDVLRQLARSPRIDAEEVRAVLAGAEALKSVDTIYTLLGGRGAESVVSLALRRTLGAEKALQQERRAAAPLRALPARIMALEKTLRFARGGFASPEVTYYRPYVAAIDAALAGTEVAR